jgi:hypothetical protein
VGGCLVVLVLLVSGCVRSTISPEPKAEPVFEMTIAASQLCPGSQDVHVACFTVEIRNRGNKSGGGTCVVRHYVRGGETLVGEGPSFSVRDVEPNQAIRQQGQIRLENPLTTLRFGSYCNPGPRL